MLETIKPSTEISHLFTQGRRFGSPFVTLIIDTSQHGQSGRVAFIAGKKMGNAVWRNGAKRRMRAICQELGGPWGGYDVIFLAKPQINEVSYSKVLNACSKGLSRAFTETD